MQRPIKSSFLSGICLLVIAFSGCGGSTNSGSPPPPKQEYPFQSAHTQQWVTQFGTGTIFRPDPNTSGLAGDTLTGVAVDPDGNVGVSASTLGNFSGYSGPVGITKDVIAKLDASGNLLWIRQFGTEDGDSLTSITSGANGDFYVGGLTAGAFPGYSNSAQNFQAIVVKFDGSGNRIWVDQFPVVAAFSWITGMAADNDGHVIVGGYSNDGSDVSNQQIFIASLDASTGRQLWLKQFGPSSSNGAYPLDDLNGVAVDASGNVYISGDTQGTFPGTATGTEGPFVLKLNASGDEQWVQQFQSQIPGAAATFFSLATTPQGDVVAGGAISSDHAIIVGQGADPSDSGILAKLDGATGNVVWLKQFSSGAGDEVSSVAVDSQGNIFAAGMTNGVLASGFTQPADDIFLLKFDPSGQNIWAQQMGLGPTTISQGLASSSRIATDLLGNIFLGNVTQGAFPGASNPNNAVEMFVAKFGP